MSIILLVIVITVQNIIFGVALYLLYKEKRHRESEFYTDYHRGVHTLRVFKPEFEFQAIGNVTGGKILERGNLSQFYMWALIEK